MTTRFARILALAGLLALSGSVSACGDSGSDQSSIRVTGPSGGPAINVNVTGIWVFRTANLVVTWTLTQTGNTVTGTSRVVDPDNAYYGQGVTGAVSGSVSSTAFTYTNTLPVLLVPNCTESDTGQLAFASSTSMTGTNTEVNSCKSGPASNVVTFVKQ